MLRFNKWRVFCSQNRYPLLRNTRVAWTLRMARGRKKSGGRREPQFGLAASLSELRLSPQDRVAGDDDETPKKPSPKRKAPEPDDDAPRERKPRAGRGGGKRRSRKRARGNLYRLFYWGA